MRAIDKESGTQNEQRDSDQQYRPPHDAETGARAGAHGCVVLPKPLDASSSIQT